MSRIVILSLVMVCFTGCQLVSSGATPVTLGQMEKTPQPGDWCGVTFPEMRKGQVTSRKLWTGQVEKVDDDTITLVEVVEQARDIGARNT